MYMKLNRFTDGLKVFDEMPDRKSASLNAIISGFAQNGHFEPALRVFKEAEIGLFRPNSVTIASVLSACQSIFDGKQMHCMAMKLGLVMDVYVATSLVTLYSSYGRMVLATRVFAEMPNKNVVSYNALFTGLLINGLPLVVLDVFKEMRECFSENPNSVTIVSVVSACATAKYLRYGRQVHGIVVKLEMEYDSMVGTALVDMYSKCGCWHLACNLFEELDGCRNLMTWNSLIAGLMLNSQSDKAVELFEQIEHEGLNPDSASWNSIISGFAQLGRGHESLKYFRKMLLTGELPNLKCITSLISACANSSAFKYGTEIHCHIIRAKIDVDVFVATATIDMYMKCGRPCLAQKVFDQIDNRPDDPPFWNAMICGYGRNGNYESAIEIFDLMQKEKVKPSSATFAGVLSACSHTGQVDKGWQMFRMMKENYSLNPNTEHISCMVDLLGRSGRLEEALKLLQELPEHPTSLLHSLLGACMSHLNPVVGEEIAMELSQLEPENPATLVVLSNIYASLGRWEDVERTRHIINERGLQKLAGISAGVT